MELIMPVGSPEAVRAAVQNGADGVIARLDASGFIRPGFLTEDQFSAAAEFCRLRGVRFICSHDYYVRDDGMAGSVALISRAYELGADEVVVSDPGLLRALGQSIPMLKCLTGLKNAVHDIAGAKLLASLGAQGVTLAPELTEAEIGEICAASPVPCAVYVYGEMCAASSGLCWLASLTGRRSANIHTCERVCQNAYGFGVRSGEHQLSMKTCSLLAHLPRLAELGVASVLTDGRESRPEYTALLSDLISRAIKTDKAPSEKDLDVLREAFPNAGESDGYYEGKNDSSLFGWARPAKGKLSAAVRADYMGMEHPRVPVTFYGVMRPHSPAQLAVSDRDGNNIVIAGPIPSQSGMRELSEVSLRSVLFNTVGTPYYCEDVKSSIADGLYMSAADLSEMKNRALAALDMKRAERPPVKGGEYRPPAQYLERKEAPEITVSVQRATQLSPELAGLKPTVLYVPVGEILASPTSITPFWENGVTEICAALPPIIRSGDEDMLMQGLEKLKGIHVSRVLIGSLQQALPLRLKGFEVRADFSANIYNSQTLRIAKDLGVLSAGVSFELELGDIKDMSKCIDTELIVYGRLPLMYSGACLIKAGTGVCACDNASHMRNSRGNSFPVLRQPGCRTLMLSGSKMFLADRAKDWANLGLWAGRLNFTTENARECVAVTARYYGLGPYEPVARTKGRYY
ncbi:MAG: DUF3656 domain-containing protein [Oscillospiraceae bacterium]|nr:DUF3656 domain-containing protein [Oscillospiraceae bacterium]